MEIVTAKPVPIYEEVCPECKSVIRYKACEVHYCSITCPVCGISFWANTCNPISEKTIEEEEK